MKSIPDHLRGRETVNPVEPDDTRYALVITRDGALVNNTTHDTRRARRDTCVGVLRAVCGDAVPFSDVRDILLSFGGADPDAALGQISALYAEEGIDIYLEDQAVPPAPVRGVPVALYSVFLGYENNELNTINHFPSKEEREEHLHRVLSSLGAAVPADADLTEHEVAARLEATMNALIDQQVTLRLAASFVPGWAV